MSVRFSAWLVVAVALVSGVLWVLAQVPTTRDSPAPPASPTSGVAAREAALEAPDGARERLTSEPLRSAAPEASVPVIGSALPVHRQGAGVSFVQLVDPRGEPVEGILARVSYGNGPLMGARNLGPRRTADGQGRIALEWPESGESWVRVTPWCLGRMLETHGVRRESERAVEGIVRVEVPVGCWLVELRGANGEPCGGQTRVRRADADLMGDERYRLPLDVREKLSWTTLEYGQRWVVPLEEGPVELEVEGASAADRVQAPAPGSISRPRTLVLPATNPGLAVEGRWVPIEETVADAALFVTTATGSSHGSITQLLDSGRFLANVLSKDSGPVESLHLVLLRERLGPLVASVDLPRPVAPVGRLDLGRVRPEPLPVVAAGRLLSSSGNPVRGKTIRWSTERPSRESPTVRLHVGASFDEQSSRGVTYVRGFGARRMAPVQFGAPPTLIQALPTGADGSFVIYGRWPGATIWLDAPGFEPLEVARGERNARPVPVGAGGF